jgi:hypothetical protein
MKTEIRGLPKVSLEVGWLSLAHNLLKKLAIETKKTKQLYRYNPGTTAFLTTPFIKNRRDCPKAELICFWDNPFSYNHFLPFIWVNYPL